jgi:hypothetical protein
MPKKQQGVKTAIAAVPIALGLLGAATQPATTTSAHPAHRASRTAAAVKEFSIPMANLQAWAGSVVVTMNSVHVEGNSSVHPVNNDCEIHLGAHTTTFQGNPDGLVLEPMNACVQPFPGQSEQSNGDWTKFAKGLFNSTITATGVPRIWPEHLDGGSASNPDHAVELHPLVAITDGSHTTDFTDNIFAGQYKGGVGEPTAFSILDNTTVDVTRNGAAVNVSFSGGTIGNFTILSLQIDRNSIAGDGNGSFRMTGEIVTEDTTVPVRMVSIKGTDINQAVGKMRSKAGATVSLEALVLFSLSPEALLDAANKSSGSAHSVQTPIQLILYGTPDDR